jgi:lipopolysaccharide/colanic/teichoic acid biosynthesis glycosyltransferase
MRFIGEENLDDFEVVPCIDGLPTWKRVLDITCICLAAPVLLPVMLLIAVIIRTVSPGPALFRQERIGFRGRRFICFKFRTMVINADTTVHQGHLNRLISDSNVPMKKLDAKGDSRLISCGLLLRSLGLDELPQIFNVLRGDMSLVGPRPCVPYEYERYAPRHRLRFEAVPGLTGLWQVSGKNRTTFDRMIDLDIQYSRTKSVWLDLQIIFKTIPALIIQTRDIQGEEQTARKEKRNRREPGEPALSRIPQTLVDTQSE